MQDLGKMISQLDELIEEYKTARAASKYDDMSDVPDKGRPLTSRLHAAIERLTLPSSVYAKRAETFRDRSWHVAVHEMYGVAVALRSDLAAGWMESVIELVHADIFADYLVMAEELLSKGYKDPAAVITGSSLEVHIRALCDKNGVDTDVNGVPKKADTMNGDLKKAGVYEGLQQKQVTSWLGLRNSAAHGKYTDYDSAEVKLFIGGLRAFILKYPA